MTENHLEKSRLVVAIVPSDTAAGRGEFRGIADAAGRLARGTDAGEPAQRVAE